MIGPVLSFENYLNLLLSAAQAYDKTFHLKGHPSTQPCNHHTIYEHELVSDFARPEQEITFFDADTPIDVIHAYATNQKSASSYSIHLPNDA